MSVRVSLDEICVQIRGPSKAAEVLGEGGPCLISGRLERSGKAE